MSKNLELWESVQKTDPNYVKSFQRAGGFSGTAINATWLAKQATEKFGPYGVGWGVEILEERYEKGAPLLNKQDEVVGHEIVHILRVGLWYMHGSTRAQVIQYGQTMFVGRNKNGPYTDEEAPKKSLTDATSKCLSLLGFSSDIHLGLWDDNKYVNERKREVAAESAAANGGRGSEPPKKEIQSAASENPGDDWKAWITDLKEQISAAPDYTGGKSIWNANAKPLRVLQSDFPKTFESLSQWVKDECEAKPKAA